VFHYDLRDLFYLDPFDHSGIYDTESKGLVLKASGIYPTTQSSAHKDICRIQIEYDIRDETEFQEGLAKLLLLAAGEPKIRRLGDISRNLKAPTPVIVNPLILETVQTGIDDYHQARWNSSAKPSKGLRHWHKFVADRPVYLSKYVPFDHILGVFDDNNSLLIATRGGLSPYPVGAAVRGNNTAVAFRVEGAEDLLPKDIP
jgi:hypothetical protein